MSSTPLQSRVPAYESILKATPESLFFWDEHHPFGQEAVVVRDYAQLIILILLTSPRLRIGQR